MKQIAILLLAIAVLSCHKDRSKIECGIIGKWELRKSEGGIAGTITYAAGNGNIIEFKSNGTYNRTSNGAINETGTYTVQSSTIAGQWILSMTTSSNTTTISIEIAAQQLVFLKLVVCCDNPDTFFERI